MPIYWGSACVKEDFNTEAFVNMHAFKNIKQAIEYIIELDQNNELYRQKLSQAYFAYNTIPLALQEKTLLDFLYKIVNSL